MHLKDIKENVIGEAIFTEEAKKLSAEIYRNEVPVDDSRFTFYQQRRHTHLLKLSLIHAACDLSREVQVVHLLRANTMLSRAERWMPKALGEFGKSRYAAASNEILQYLGKRTMPATVSDIWKVVDRVLSKLPELTEVLSNLKSADKIQTMTVKGKTGYMPKNVEKPEWKKDFILMDWLTDEEKI
jgi:hypothetical protein